MFIHQNISAPATLLDSPTRERFVQELTTHDYDIVGISSIVVNVGKVREMCRLVRQHSPRSTIVVGGHPSVSARIRALRLETEREFGAMATLINRTLGPLLLWSSNGEALRHPSRRRLEPRTFVERRAIG